MNIIQKTAREEGACIVLMLQSKLVRREAASVNVGRRLARADGRLLKWQAEAHKVEYATSQAPTSVDMHSQLTSTVKQNRKRAPSSVHSASRRTVLVLMS